MSKSLYYKGAIYILSIATLFVTINFVLYHTSKPSEEAIEEAKVYAKKHGLRTDVIALCDFSIHSGKPRFWIYDCRNKEVLDCSLCAHGNGKGNRPWRVKASNEIGSGCSSIGMFRIERFHTMKNKYHSLKLTGLSKTNSNAMQRGILIHSGFTAKHFPYGIFPLYIPLTKESEGCFAINDDTLAWLIRIMAQREEKLLLYAYM